MRHYLKALLLFICCHTNAMNSGALQQQADETISTLYHSIKSTSNKSIVDKLNWFSAYFKNKPYFWGALGEGAHARYDDYPLYRLDAFDCDTYVNTMLALALSDSLTTFQRCINQLRYRKGRISYINRNHFTSLDWNKNNQKQGVFKDITTLIKDKDQHSVALYSVTPINKATWYEYKKPSSIRIHNHQDAIKKQRLIELQNKTKKLTIQKAVLPYIPLNVLFTANHQPRYDLFAQIPNGSIIEIVRPNWDLRQEIGTFLDVSHLGFAFWDQGVLYFRNASQTGAVIDQPLIAYLKDALSSPTIKGINIQKINTDLTHC